MLYNGCTTAMAHGCDPSTGEDKGRGLQIQSQPDLHCESEAGPGCIVKLCLNK